MPYTEQGQAFEEFNVYYTRLTMAKDKLFKCIADEKPVPNIWDTISNMLSELIPKIEGVVRLLPPEVAPIVSETTPYLNYFNNLRSPDFNFLPELLPDIIGKSKGLLKVLTRIPRTFRLSLKLRAIILALNALLLYFMFLDFSNIGTTNDDYMDVINREIENFLLVVDDVLLNIVELNIGNINLKFNNYSLIDRLFNSIVYTFFEDKNSFLYNKKIIIYKKMLSKSKLN